LKSDRKYDDWDDEDDESEEDETSSEYDNDEEEEEDFEEDKESDEYEEIFNDIVDDDLILEGSEERGGYVYLRYRDKRGRFASPDIDSEIEKDKEIDRKIDKRIREYRKKISLPYNEKILLLRLVDDFSDREKLFNQKGFINPKVSHFKRVSYHRVFLDFSNSRCRHLGRSAFSQFINRMVDKGFVRKIKHGKKLYLKITKEGLEAVYRFWNEYPGESWRRP